MLDPSRLKPDAIHDTALLLKKKGYELDAENYMKLDEQRRRLQAEVDEMRHKYKMISKKRGEIIRKYPWMKTLMKCTDMFWKFTRRMRLK